MCVQYTHAAEMKHLKSSQRVIIFNENIMVAPDFAICVSCSVFVVFDKIFEVRAKS